MCPTGEPIARRDRPRIAVVGAGITGLAASHRLIELSQARQQPLEVILFEAGSRPGGMIATEHRDGCVIEAGPDAFLSEKPAALALCQRLGIEDQLIATRDEFRRTYVVRAGRLCPLPDGFQLLAPTRLWPVLASPLFSWPGKLRMGLELLLPRGAPHDESLGSFVRRRLGTEVLQRVAQPLLGGIYTGDPERLSLAATMPRFLEMERAQRSIVWALWQQRRRHPSTGIDGSGARWSLFLSFRNGMQTLVDRLSQRLPEGVLRLSTPIHTLQPTANGWELNATTSCDAVILATPAPISASLLRPVAGELASELQEIAHASTAIVTLAYRREDIPHPLSGFGFVVPHVEQRAIIAGSFSSVKFSGRAPNDVVLVRTFVGGALQPHLYEQDDAEMESSVRRELRALLGVAAPPLFARVTRYPTSMPQYHIGHLGRIDRIARAVARLPRLALAGNVYRGVGIPDCIHSGEIAAEAIMQALIGRETFDPPKRRLETTDEHG